MSAKWKLDPAEVDWAASGGSSSSAGQFARKLKTTHARLRLTHRPTGVAAEGTIPSGNYSKKEMQRLKEELRKSLFATLEKMVAKHLRIPGR